jgi:hypothetical protein
VTRLNEEVGREIEEQLASLLRLWAYSVQAVDRDGVDLWVRRAGLSAQLEVKGMRDWVTNPAQGRLDKRTRGRPQIRAYSHEKLMEQVHPVYVFCQWRARRNGMHSDRVTPPIALTSLTWSPASFIQLQGRAAFVLPAKLVLSLPLLQPNSLLYYMRDDNGMG